MGQASAPANPPSNQCKAYFNTVTGVETWINSTGGSCGPAGGVAGLPGLPDSSTSPVTAASYLIRCDSGMTQLDRVTLIRFRPGAAAVTVPLSTDPGCGGGFVVAVVNDGAGTLTFTRSSPDTFSVVNGFITTDGATSFTMTNGQFATLSQGATGLWEIRLSVSGVYAETGTFTNAQENEFTTSILNGLDISAEQQAGQGAGQFSTNAFTAGIAIPGSATVSHSSPVNGFLTNSSATTFGVAGNFQARCLVISTRCWAGGFVVTDVSSLGGPLPALIGAEADLAVNNAGPYTVANGFRVGFYSQSSGVIGGTHGIEIGSFTNGQLNTAIQSDDNAAQLGAYFGYTAGSGARGSQGIQLQGFNGSAPKALLLTADPNGNFLIAPQSGGQATVHAAGSDVAMIVLNDTAVTGQAWAFDSHSDGTAAILPQTDPSKTLGMPKMSIGGGSAINLYKTATDSPGAITITAATCTDRGVTVAGLTTGAVIMPTANYALEANIYPAPGQAVAGTAHYRICNSTAGNITLAVGSTFNLAILQ